MRKVNIFLIFFSFTAEIFCLQLLLIFIPLVVFYSGGGEINSSISRSAGFIGPVLFGYYIGKLTDIFNKRILGASIALTIALVSGFFALTFKNFNYNSLIFYMIFLSIFSYFLINIRSSVMPMLIQDSSLNKANGFFVVIENTVTLVSPGICSLLLYFGKPQFGFYLTTFLFFVSAIAYFFGLRQIENNKPSNSNDNSIFKTWGILKSNKQLLHLCLLIMASNAFLAIYTLYLIIFISKHNITSNILSPFIMIPSACSAILAGLYTVKLLPRYSLSNFSIFCSLAIFLAGVLPLISKNLFSIILSSCLEGFFTSSLVIAVWTLRQRVVSKETLGQVTGLTSALFKLSITITLPLAGILSSMYGESSALLFGSSLILVGIIPFIYNRSDFKIY